MVLHRRGIALGVTIDRSVGTDDRDTDAQCLSKMTGDRVDGGDVGLVSQDWRKKVAGDSSFLQEIAAKLVQIEVSNGAGQRPTEHGHDQQDQTRVREREAGA